MLVVAVGFFDAGGGAAIALMARRAAKFVRVVGLQQIGLGMAGERVSVLIGLFAFEGHGRGGEFDWLPNPPVAGVAAVHPCCFGGIFLAVFLLPGFGFILLYRRLRRR